MDVKNMVHIEITSWYPREKNQEVMDKFLELMRDPGMPSSVKSFKIFSKAVKEGIKTIAFLEIQPGKMDEAYTDLDPLLEQLVEIEGYNIEYGIAVSYEETMANQQQS